MPLLPPFFDGEREHQQTADQEDKSEAIVAFDLTP
jgi:hypothetical protein